MRTRILFSTMITLLLLVGVIGCDSSYTNEYSKNEDDFNPYIRDIAPDYEFLERKAAVLADPHVSEEIKECIRGLECIPVVGMTLEQVTMIYTENWIWQPKLIDVGSDGVALYKFRYWSDNELWVRTYLDRVISWTYYTR